MNSTQTLAINKEIKRLLAIGCIKEVKRTESLFLSNIFTVIKKNGDLRLVINSKDWNQFLAFHHFKMESFQTANDLIQEVDWMINLNLKEAYHSVPVTPDHQIYHAFFWDGKCYVYCVLPFGLGPAPRRFTKITKPILVHIRQNLVIRCVMILIFGKTKSDCLQKAKKVITMLQELGFTISIQKSILEPTQQIEFLGLILDSIQMKVFLPEPKVLDLIESCQANFSMTSVIFSKSSSSCLLAVFPASTFYRAIQADIHQAISKTNNFRKTTEFVVRGQIRNTVVDSQCTSVEWASSSLAFPFSDHNYRCYQKKGDGVTMQQTQNSGQVDSRGGFSPHYCLTKISIRAKRLISRVFSLFIVPSPFLYIARTKAVLTGLKAY